jgi:catechol 2,3-dioxygenase-like lactoylglutathione lyase family enzyme
MTTTPPVATEIDFIYVFTKNFSAVLRFYETVLGLRCTKKYERAPGAEFECGRSTFVIVDCEAHNIEFNPNTHPIALGVEDFDAARTQLESRGVSFKHTLDSGVCYMGFFEDPDGNALMIHHRYASEDSVG